MMQNQDEAAFVLSWSGGVLCHDFDADKLSIVPLASLRDDHVPVMLPLPAARKARRYEDFINGRDEGTTLICDLPTLGRMQARLSDRGRMITFSRDDVFLSVEPDHAVRLNRHQAGAWEEFLVLTAEDLSGLRHITGHDWVIRSSATLAHGSEAHCAAPFVLSIGALDIPLRFNLPLAGEAAPFRFVVMQDGWRIDEIVLFNPVIYYTSFRSPAVHETLYLSVRSLLEFGRYEGHVHVLTDLPRPALQSALPMLEPGRLSVQALEPSDWVGYVASKYSILEWPEARSHQPVVYMDPDIVFNADITEMLIGIALAERISAPIEEYSSLSNSPSVGAVLLQLDHCNPREARGVNAGTLGIPNLVQHGGMVALIRSVIMNYLDRHGREQLHWVDQEVVNYVSYKIGRFETHVISRFVRYGGVDDAFDAGRLSGLIHFWGCERQARPQLMQDYIQVRRAVL